MRRKLAIVVAGLLVAGGAGVGSIIVSSSATAATTLTVIEHAVSDHLTIVGKGELSPGNLLTFHNPIYDSTDTTRVGRDQGSCIRITQTVGNTHSGWECTWTTFVENGASSMTVETPYYDTGLGRGAITGGTGTYDGATGSFDLSCTSRTRCTFTFNLS
jgi:allene oxide cyclase